MMLTGRHFVRDISCKKCDAKLGWMYEFATEETQRYKEGRVILERALINEVDGFWIGRKSIFSSLLVSIFFSVNVYILFWSNSLIDKVTLPCLF